MTIEGRTAIVTGAAQGVGAAIAEALYHQGAAVAVADIDIERAEKTAAALDPSGGRSWPATVDVRKRDSVQRVIDDAVARCGSLDILVNNAARTVSRSIWEIEPEEWDDVLAVNLRGVFFGCQLAGPHMRARGWSRIINLSSLAGQQGGLVAGTHYAASKAGVIVLTKIVARELAPHGVTVNAIAPAAIKSPVMDALRPEQVEEITKTIPVGRVGRPEEVAALAAFLASEEAGYITGATFDINGGLLMR